MNGWEYLSVQVWLCLRNGRRRSIKIYVQYKLDNLIAVIDYNNMQFDGTNDEIMPIAPVSDKLSSFGWKAIEVDGHNIPELYHIFKEPNTDQPLTIIAKTTKAKGIPRLENMPQSHHSAINPEDYEFMLNEITEGNMIDFNRRNIRFWSRSKGNEEIRRKNAVVTGCNRGIGEAILEEFVRAGANVWALTRTYDKALNEVGFPIEGTSCLDRACSVRPGGGYQCEGSYSKHPERKKAG